VLAIVVLAAGVAISAQDKYTVEVPGGLAFSEFRGYKDWPVVAMSENGGVFAVILGNPVAIAAFREGVPGQWQAPSLTRRFIEREKHDCRNRQ
jgi:hypothetical protein